ncbi:hypothetical protein [Pedobacter terrae]|uniref:hypothetical protein n=1 Tax=Pedobacter terrae TaxID=405671 RepID=UPI002FFAFE50
MLENITGKLLMAIAVGAAFGLFYTLLLHMHGVAKIKYKPVALSIGTLIFLLGLHSFEAAGIACFIIGIGVFVLAIALMARGAADSLKTISAKFSSGNKPQNTEVQRLNKLSLSNYAGVIFHLVVIVLISLSIFTYSNDTILNQEKMDRLIGDAIFQFTSTIVLILLGIFNPFVSPSAKLLAIAGRVNSIKYPKLYRLLSNKKFWVIFKALICLGIILYFTSEGYFSLLAWDNATPYMNVYVFLIGFFITVNLVQMVRMPEYFYQKNLFRITLLLRSAFISIFLSAILVFSTLFISSILGIDINRLKVSSEAIIFLGYNMIMCYNEFRLARV